jgi:hypothetical protein
MEWFASVFDWFSNPGQSNAAQWGVSVLALLVASLALGNSLATSRRLRQEARRAKLRGFMQLRNDRRYVVIANDGAATATNISATIDGMPLNEFIGPQ